MNKKRNGYTLIEVIVCVLLIAVIGTFFTVTMSKKKDNDDTRKEEKEETIFREAIDVLSSNAMQTGELSTYVSTDTSGTSDDVYTFFCLTKDRIIREGLLPEDNSILKELDADKYLKISKNNLGKIEYTRNVSQDECKYYVANISTITNDGVGDFGADDEENSYGLKQTFSKKEGVENQFQVRINFTKELYREKITPFYILFVLDVSGSMRWNDSSGGAKEAIKNFGEEILSRITNSKIGFLPFGDTANPRYFSSELWTTDINSFKNAVSSINYGGSNTYSQAYRSIINTYNVKNLTDNNNMVYVVFFSDAGDDEDCDSSKNRDLAVNQVAPVIDKFIFIAYNPGNVTCLESFSSEINNNYSDRSIYKLSSNSDVDDIMKDVSNKVAEETQYKNVKLTIRINKEYFSIIADDKWEYDKDENTISQKINFNPEDGELESNLNFEISYKSKNLMDNSLNETDPISIIEGFDLLFTKKDGTEESISISKDKLPSTIITTSEKYVVND